MALRDALPKATASLCKVGKNIEHYSKDDVETLADWIQNRIPIRQINIALKTEYPEHCVAENTFFVHLRAQCQCPDGTPFRGSWK